MGGWVEGDKGGGVETFVIVTTRKIKQKKKKGSEYIFPFVTLNTLKMHH